MNKHTTQCQINVPLLTQKCNENNTNKQNKPMEMITCQILVPAVADKETRQLSRSDLIFITEMQKCKRLEM